MNVAFRLVMQTLGRKNFMPNNFLEINQNFALARFDVIMKQDWPIEQCLLHIRVFFGRKTKKSCFDLFTDWAIKQCLLQVLAFSPL